jgi:hypothetical protein
LALIVHGSLLIILCFAAGVIQSNNLVMALAVLTAAVVAGGAALHDVVTAYGADAIPKWARPYAEAFIIFGWALAAISAGMALGGFLFL